MSTTVYIDNSNVILLSGLHSEIDDAFVSDATVTVTIKDADGANVAGTTWPKTMSYVSASDGNYRAILPDTIVLMEFADYTAEITASAGADRVGRWSVAIDAIKRTD